jgi:hypothetical protein
VQWEFAGRLGPPPGRYVVRRYAGDDAQSVVVISEAAAPRRVSRKEPRDTVPVTVVTVIDADPLFDDATAAVWLRDAVVTPEFTGVFARLLAAFRVASEDPFLGDLDLTRAWRTRIGFGTGEQVAEGAWTESRELATAAKPRRPRRSEHRPADRLAALLAGRDVALASEELTLRARLDLDAGRVREAAVQLEAALTCACAELAPWATQGDVAKRLAELETYSGVVSSCASAARAGTLDADATARLNEVLERLEAALRARALYSAESR